MIHQDEHPGIWDSIAGILFLGTPHGGMRGLAGQLLWDICAAKYDIEEGVLQSLTEGNELLLNVVRNFAKFVVKKTPQPRVFCFYEQKKSAIRRVIGDRDGEKVRVVQPIFISCLRYQWTF